jgi:hypothetical protein
MPALDFCTAGERQTGCPAPAAVVVTMTSVRGFRGVGVRLDVLHFNPPIPLNSSNSRRS